MAVANAIDVDIFSLIILAFIFGNTNKRAEHTFVQQRLFLSILGAIALLLAADAITRVVDGKPGTAAYCANWAATLALYAVTPVVACLYAMYADYQAYRREKRFRKLGWPLAAFIALVAAFNLSSVFTGWTFTITDGNRYARGPFIAIHTLSCMALLTYTVIFILWNRKRIDRRHLPTLLAFGLIPAAATALQAISSELSLVWGSMALAMLLLYLNMQDRRMDTDYLTGVYNRRMLDSYLRERVQAGSPRKSFSAILIDLDGFKEINDTLGHAAGDDALTDAVSLIRGCTRHGDFISRWGGDEFLIILDIQRREALEDMVNRLRACFDRFNGSGRKPYRLGFSTGYDVYDMGSGMEPDQFVKRIDAMMYRDKKKAVTGH
jgi:diguanylate cyclase (GGDEF)-like protein